MIRRNRLNEYIDPNDIVRFGDIAYAGYIWTITDIRNGVVTLLMNEPLRSMEFSRPGQFGYAGSEVRRYLLTNILPRLEAEGARLIPMSFDEYGCDNCRDKIYLLSPEEVHVLPQTVRQFTNDWWLRSMIPASYDYDDEAESIFCDIPMFVTKRGDVTYQYNNPKTVRPAIRVRIEDLQSPVAY